MELAVVCSQIDEGAALAAYYVCKYGVIVAFVFASEDKHHWWVDGLHGYIASVYIGGLGVIDVGYALYLCNVFQTMLYTWEIFKTTTYDAFLDS